MNWDIQRRVTFSALLPLAFLVIALLFYYLSQLHDEIKNAVNLRGNAIAKEISAASGHGISKEHIARIEPILTAAFQQDDVSSITLINNEGSVIYRKSRKNDGKENEKIDFKDRSSSLVFMRRIVNHTLPATIDEVSEQKHLGWVIVELSHINTNAQQIKLTWEGLLFTSIVFFIATIMISRVSRRFAQPVQQLTHYANELEKGNFDINVKSGASGELANLERSLKSMAASLKRNRDELETEVSQATSNLLSTIQVVEKQNKELMVARQSALSASKIKSDFLANMSHEIRTPMNGILGFVKLLNKTHLNSVQKEYLSTVEKSAQNLMHVINDVLDISKIEAGKTILQNVEYNLRECIEEVIALLAPVAQEKKLELVNIIYSDTPLDLFGDAQKVRQILTNLMGNAIKFTETGEIVIRTMLEDIEEEKATIKITVTDSGIGIPVKDIPRLFHTFEQADNSSKRPFGGTGLGLAISKSLAKLMGGVMDVQSKEGVGSTFSFTFTHNMAICDPPPAQEIVEDIRSRRNLISVYVYEPHESALTSLRHILEDLDLNPQYCNGLDQMLACSVAERSDNCVCLVAVPATTKDEESNNYLPKIAAHNCKMVAIINSADVLIHEHYRRLQCRYTVTKPTRYRDIVNAIADEAPDGEPVRRLEKAAVNSNENLSHSGFPDAVYSGLNILVAEDNSINAKYIFSVLKETGASLKFVSDGKQVLEALEDEDFHLILMDIHMPVMSGVEACEVIRQSHRRYSDIPIIALTADALPQDRESFLNAGINSVLIKPVDDISLLQEINQQLASEATAVTQAQENPSDKPEIKERTRIQQDLLKLLLEELPQFLHQLNDAFARKNISELRNFAHKLHGATSYCNLPSLKNAVMELERATKHADNDLIQTKLEAVNSVIATVISENA